MADGYKKMMDSTFQKYYKRFRELNALSKEYAVTIEELFPDEKPLLCTEHRVQNTGEHRGRFCVLHSFKDML